RLKPVVGPYLGVELRELVTERLGLLEAPKSAMMIEPMWGDGFGLLQVVGQQLPVRRLLVLHLVAREEVVEATVEDVRPIERLRDLPREAVDRRRNLLLVGRDGRRTEDELQHVEACLFDPRFVLGLQQ